MKKKLGRSSEILGILITPCGSNLNINQPTRKMQSVYFWAKRESFAINSQAAAVHVCDPRAAKCVDDRRTVPASLVCLASRRVASVELRGAIGERATTATEKRATSACSGDRYCDPRKRQASQADCRVKPRDESSTHSQFHRTDAPQQRAPRHATRASPK